MHFSPLKSEQWKFVFQLLLIIQLSKFALFIVKLICARVSCVRLGCALRVSWLDLLSVFILLMVNVPSSSSYRSYKYKLHLFTNSPSCQQAVRGWRPSRMGMSAFSNDHEAFLGFLVTSVVSEAFLVTFVVVTIRFLLFRKLLPLLIVLMLLLLLPRV